jgi:hypothetical protein
MSDIIAAQDIRLGDQIVADPSTGISTEPERVVGVSYDEVNGMTIEIEHDGLRWRYSVEPTHSLLVVVRRDPRVRVGI